MDRRAKFLHYLPLGLVGLLLGCLGAGAQPQVRPEPRTVPLKSLQILSRIQLPEGHSVPTDIRWASDDSVLVSRYRDGVAEIGLDGAKRRDVVPAVAVLNQLKQYSQVAVSNQFVIAADLNWHFVWRLQQPPVKGRVQFRREDVVVIHDIDLAGDRLLVLGLHQGAKETFSADGGIAYLGSLKPGLPGLRPVLFDEGGLEVPHLKGCMAAEKGAARFQPDGTFLVVPGFQKGAFLFNGEGRQIRSWTSEQLGLDTDCSKLAPEEVHKLDVDAAEIVRWFNSYHIVDDILPLPQGPGLLIRSADEAGRIHWVLKVLTPSRIVTYEVPLVGNHPADRLRGDFRGGRIALLLAAGTQSFRTEKEYFPGELVLAQLPGAKEVKP